MQECIQYTGVAGVRCTGEYARVSAIVCINILAEHEVTGYPYRMYSHVAIMLQYLCRYLTCSCDIHVTWVMQICNMYVFCVLQTRTVMHVTCMLYATCLCQVRNWDISGMSQACNRSVNVQVCTGMYRSAQVCTGLYRYVRACTGMYGPVLCNRTVTDMYIHVHATTGPCIPYNEASAQF